MFQYILEFEIKECVHVFSDVHNPITVNPALIKDTPYATNHCL
jgi:hypothetical protein